VALRRFEDVPLLDNGLLNRYRFAGQGVDRTGGHVDGRAVRA
jgi:hypothetical protein